MLYPQEKNINYMPETKTALSKQIEEEVTQYQTLTLEVGENPSYSQSKLIRRISLFENKIYPKGKFDKQGNYKYWFDIIAPRIESEVKNIDFDTKDVLIYSEPLKDQVPCLIVNLALKEYLKTTGQAEEINSAVEEGAGWGNVVWKKIKKTYERVDLANFYVINQTAEHLDQTPVIERHQMSSSDLRSYRGVWENVDEVLKDCKSDTFKATAESNENNTTVPYYDIYERNGEVCVKDLKEYQGKDPKKGDEDKYIYARIISAGSKASLGGVTIKYILFAEETNKKNSDIYKEYHRSRYKGRWFREGLYEIIFDLQVRANEIGNQLARGLEYASKTVFITEDKLVVQNILTDIKNGDIIKAKTLSQVPVRMEGFDQLVADWNRIIGMANELANSREIVQGENLPSGTPFRLGALLNQNANKLFDFIREKLAIPFTEIFDQWIIPDLIRNLKGKDILRLTGDSDMMTRLQVLIVNDWYINNLIAIGPHTPEIAETLKQEKLAELKARPELFMSGVKQILESFKPRVSVIITGEQINLDAELQTIGTFISLEMDPVRRSALIEMAMRKKGLDVGQLPKTPPQPTQPMPSPIQIQPKVVQ